MRVFLALAIASCSSSSDAVFPADTAVVDLTMVGGLAPTPGPGSTCAAIDDEYTYSLADHHLGWKSCQSPSIGGTYDFVHGETTLSDADHTALVDALHALGPAKPPCGGDITETFQFAALSGTTVYGQASCMPGASDVAELLRSAAGI